jgi:uncharacterized Zn finger protein
MDWRALINEADAGSLARGRDYARRKLVTITSATSTRVRAEAHGSSTYDVTIGVSGWSCTCPVGVRGDFCKHLVATVLVVDGATGGDATGGDAELDGPDEAADLVVWLTDLDASAAQEIVERLATDHPKAMATLRTVRARSSGDVSVYRELVDSLRTRRHLDYRDANRHGEQAHRVADELERGLGPTTAAPLIPLLETAIELMVRVIVRADDSSGVQSGAAARMVDLHCEAATLAPPDPDRLARWLVKNGADPESFLDFDVVAYAVPLGDRGLTRYRKELAKALAKAPDNYAARHALQRLAVLDGDVAEIVRLAGGPLHNTFQYAAVVEALLEAGHDEEALRYAVAGTELAPSFQQTPRLYDTAVRLLRDRGDLAEGLRLRQRQLQQLPDEASYASLRKAANTAAGDWPRERLSALDTLLDRNPRAWMSVLLDEGEVDLVWAASADLPINPTMLVRLLRERAKTHPADVFDRYVALIEETLRVADQQNYRQAVAYLHDLRRACDAAGTQPEYAAVVARLLDEHRRRPTLVEMLARLGG